MLKKLILTLVIAVAVATGAATAYFALTVPNGIRAERLPREARVEPRVKALESKRAADAASIDRLEERLLASEEAAKRADLAKQEAAKKAAAAKQPAPKPATRRRR